MPTEDPEPDAPRIGTELELFKTADAGRAFRTPPPLIVPAPRRRFSPLRRPGPVWFVDDDADLQRARLTVVLVCLVAVVALVTVVAVARRGGGSPPTAADRPPPTGPTLPALPAPVPVSVEPASPSPEPTRTTVVPRPTAPRPSPSRTTHRPSPPPPPPTRTVYLTVGAVISLQVSGRPGVLVRHHDFLGRIDEFGPDSSRAERLDATFTVAKAPARGCVSLESVNFPGHFLRHRNFVIHLDRADDSELFRQDSAFCQVDLGSGVIALRSLNFPDRYITAHRSALRLSDVDPATATGFLVRPAA